MTTLTTWTWSNLTNYSLRSDLTNQQTQSQTGTYARGYYGISILIPCWVKKCYKFIHTKQNTNYKDINNTKWINYTHCSIGLHKAWKFMHIDHQVTCTPCKLTGTYIGCHTTQQIQHVSLCYQGPWPKQVPSSKQHHQDNTNQTYAYQKYDSSLPGITYTKISHS